MTTLIREVRIEGFRSFRRATLGGLEDYVPVIGLNSTGKSNVLRALNLFFNGVTDEDRTPASLGADYADFLSGSRRQKRIAVSVEFDLTGGYEVRHTGEFLKTHGIATRLVIERYWTLGPSRVDLVDSFRFGPSRDHLEEVVDQDRATILALIQSVEFRYVPNHLRPADLIASEIQALRPKMINRFRRTKAFKESGVDDSMAALAKVARSMFASVSEGTHDALDGRAVAPDIPSDFAELAFQVGLNTLTEAGAVQPTAAQGSGTQSFILLHVLHLLDSTMREQGFGWKQYALWAIEEPESYLHAGLRSQFADDLRRFAGEERRQVFVTTHQDEFVRVADHAWLASMDNGESTIERLPTREAILQSNRRGISSFIHPLIAHPDNPVVITEGTTDELYLRRAGLHSKRRPRWRLSNLEDMDETQGGGDNVKTYLGANRAVLASRSLDSPIFVLRDWEDTKVETIDKVVNAAHETSRAWRCPAHLCNPQLGSTFRGIERFLPTELIEAVIPASKLVPCSKEEIYPLGIDGSTLHAYKPKLAEAMASNPNLDPGPHLVDLHDWLDAEVERAFGELPPTLFQ